MSMTPLRDELGKLFIQPNQLQQKSSQTEITQASPPPRSDLNAESAQILGQIIDRSRLAKGWGPLDPNTQSLAIQTWYEILNTASIPYKYWDELYRRAMAQRSKMIAAGKEPMDICPELLLAQWPELRDTVEWFKPAEKPSEICQRCGSSNFEFKWEESTGKILGVMGRCDHRPIVEGEWLWSHLKLGEPSTEKLARPLDSQG